MDKLMQLVTSNPELMQMMQDPSVRSVVMNSQCHAFDIGSCFLLCTWMHGG